MKAATFVMAGGGTGGHVIPLLAVAKELERRGHMPFFVGTQRGLEAKLVPQAGFPIEWIEIGGLKRVGITKMFRTLGQLPVSLWQAGRLLGRWQPAAVFSMGGFVAGPVMLAALWRRLPLVVMEPNAMPGFTNRRLGSFVARAMLSFPEAEKYFARGRTELTGLPVRAEFFAVPGLRRREKLHVLVTGGSQGSRTLNRAVVQSWPLFREAKCPVRLMHQTGAEAHAEIAGQAKESGIEMEVVPFITDMPGAFAEADLVVSRSGAGAVAELAAAGRPAILAPFPFSADDHQLKNAQAMERAGAARVVPDEEMSGERLFQEVKLVAGEPGRLERMGEAARRLAKPGAAERAAEILEELAARQAARG